MKKILTMFLVVLSLVLLTGCKSYEITIPEEQKAIEMFEKEEVKVEAQYTEGTTLIWNSSDENVATVVNGTIKGVKAGQATITVTMEGHEKVSCTITVKVNKIPVKEAAIDGPSEIFVGATAEYTITYQPADAEVVEENWSVKDTKVATIEGKTVTAVKVGKTAIRVDYKDAAGNVKFVEKEIEVKNIDVSGISFIEPPKEMLVTEEATLKVKVHPNDATNKEVTFKSSDEKIATVDQTGKVKAIAAGRVEITVTSKANPEKFNTAVINVKNPVVESITVTHTKDSMLIGETDTLTVKVLPALAKQEVKWTVTPEDCAKIENGTLTAIKEGKVIVKAEATDGSGISFAYNLTIVKPQSTIVKIGETEYKSLTEALAAAKAGDVLVMDGQEISEDITIDKSGITITNNKKDSNKVIFSASIILAKDVKDVTLEGLEFVRGSAILGNESGQENITIDNCKFINVTADASIGFMTFQGPAKNVTFKNSEVISNKGPRFFRFVKTIDGLTIENSRFENGGGTFDWLYNDGSIGGNVTVVNNYFGSTAQSGLFIKGNRGGNYLFKDNTFQDINNVAIDIRNLVPIEGVEPKLALNIIHNTFNNANVSTDNNWGCIRLRFKGIAEANLTINVNYNKFTGWNHVDLVEDAGPDKLKIQVANCDHNYIDGMTQAEVDKAATGEKDKMFSFIGKSWANVHETKELLEIAYGQSTIDTDPNVLLVGTTTKYTKKPYATLAEALEAAKEGNVIYLLPGAHTGNVTISKNNIRITSLNGGFNPNKTYAREAEATYDGVITLAKELKGTEISGIKFIGKAQILNTIGAVGETEKTATNLDGFTFKNNIVESAAVDVEGFLITTENTSCYSKDIRIINNYFTAKEGFTANNMLVIDNNYDIQVIGNVFENMTVTNAIHFVDKTKGISGNNTKIDSNTFKNITGNAMTINWLSVLPLKFEKGVVSFQDNKFENVTGTCIDLGCMNNTDIYEAIYVRFNTFTTVGTAVKFARVSGPAHVQMNYNIFTDVPTVAYIKYGSDKAAYPEKLNAKDNLFLNEGKVITPAADKLISDKEDMIDITTTITKVEDMPKFNTNATSIEIVCPELFVGDKVNAEIKYNPEKITNFGVKWSTSDPTIATVNEYGLIEVLKDGKVTITATYLFDETITATKEFNIISYTEIRFDFDNDGYLEVNESFDIKATIDGVDKDGKIVWTSSNPDVAKVENGKVTGLKEGEATITAKIEGKDIATTYTIVVKDLTEMNELLKMLVENNNGVVWNQTINYHGYEKGYESVPHNIFGSVNNYYAAEAPKVTENPIRENALNMPNAKDGDQVYMKSIEFITIHDTGAASPSSTARANSNWCVNPSNDGTSWHYTIGNDGIFHQVEDNKITWHAGDGTSWGTTTILTDTGIKADPNLRNRPKITAKDGFIYLNGEKTKVATPAGAPNTTNDLGIPAPVKNGTYHIPTLHVTKGYNSVLAARGGNNNSIGIETAVNTDSDVYLTWQYVAKQVARLLVKHNLTPERVVFHNTWSNKTCPQTMMRAGKTEMFLDMVYVEYYVLKNFSDYKIEFISNNPDIIDNSGRVIGHGPYTTTEVSYQIKVTKGAESKSAVCHCTVQGSHIH